MLEFRQHHSLKLLDVDFPVSIPIHLAQNVFPDFVRVTAFADEVSQLLNTDLARAVLVEALKGRA
jgi:hypothetical protein